MLLRHTVIVEPRTGEGAYGPVFGDPVEVKALVEYRTRRVTGPDNEDVVSQADVTTDPSDEIPVLSRVTVDGAPMTAIEVVRPSGPNGTPMLQRVVVA